VLESILSGKGVAPDPLTSSVVDKVVFPERESERERESPRLFVSSTYVYMCTGVNRERQRIKENVRVCSFRQRCRSRPAY